MQTGHADIFLAKFSSQGEVIWAQTLGGGANDAHFGRDITIDQNDNIYITTLLGLCYNCVAETHVYWLYGQII